MKNEARWALIGNPNAGKTTLFNSMTGARESVGNRPGVTVEVKTRRLRGGGALVSDLPGVYSLSACSEEERCAADYLRAEPLGLLIDVVDASNLERNLYLTTQLLEQGLPTVVALNMMDEARAQGMRIDLSRLSVALGVPVVPVCARTGEGVQDLIALCARFARPPARRTEPGRSAEARYRDAAHITSLCVQKKPRGKTRSDRLDGRLVAGRLALPVFLAVMGLVFYLTFDSVGAWLTRGVEALLGFLTEALRGALAARSAPEWLCSLLCDGLCGGVGGVLTFLPQITILFFLLSLLEDSGYLARTAFLSDPLLRRFGLSGRAFIPMLMGFGCTVPAAMAARTLSGRREKTLTLLLLPFMSCSAKLPVYGLVAGAVFPRRRALVVLSLYALGLLLSLLSGALLSRTLFCGERSHFVLELPPYRLPRLKSALLFTAERVQHFLEKAGTVILLMSLLLWAGMRFTPLLSPAAQPQSSLLGLLGGLLAPAFRPAGFGSWQAAVALLTGIVAKEAVVSTLTLVSGAHGGIAALFTPASAYAFLVFTLLYTPCAAALATMKRELGGKRWLLFCVLYQTAAAYLSACLAFRILSTILT